MQKLWIEGIGVVHIGGYYADEELERMLTALSELPIESRARQVEAFTFEGHDLGITLTGLQLIHAPLTAVDVSRMFAAEAHAMRTTIEMRARWARVNGAPFVAVIGTPTACRTCLSCGEALPEGQLFGRCLSCSIVLNTVAMEADIELPARQRQ